MKDLENSLAQVMLNQANNFKNFYGLMQRIRDLNKNSFQV